MIDAISFVKREGTMVALMLLDLTRETDTVARLGGDEFAIIMPYVKNTSCVAPVAELITSELSEPVKLDGSLVESGTSIGVGLYPCDGEDVEDRLRTSDQALCEAKKRGRGTYQFFDVSINEKARAARILDNEI